MREIDGGGGNERVRFTVELRPGETTIVSWKKLLKDAAKGGGGGGGGGEASTSAAPPVSVNPSLEARLAPGQPAENELKDGHPTRFTDVIEKIERLYMGKHSSDEEDLNDVPDDDEYDTEDSFIDDAELDDYFQVDNSAIKHDGFFVNRGKLERIIEPTSLPDQQPKKRRRKNSGNDKGDDENGQLPNKTMKVGNKATRKPKKVVPWDVGLPHVVALPSVHNEEITFQSQTNMTAKKKSTGIKTSLDQSVSSSISNIDATLTITGNVERANAPVLKPHDKNVSVQSKSEPALLSNSNGKLDHSHKGREKDGNIERSDINTSGGKVPMQNAKTPVLQRKEGSSIKPKSTNLEKTILELEKMVAESRPQSMEVHDADMASQAGKKRLPREIKLKLAKVARQAQANHGKIPNELVNRLMNILGHWIQVRTLKRNLKDMVATGLTAKKEKDERVQQMKKDVDELIKMRVPYIRSKILEQQAGEPNDFQEMGNEEKEKIKRKYGMDDAIEDKICDLYDLYVDGVDEEAGPQARKLYSELAHLWPEGFMDNHGIKRAICRAKDRKRALYGRSKEEEEKIKRKKVVQKTEGTVRVDSSTISQPQHTQEKSVSEPNHHGPTASNKLVPSITSSNSSNKSVPSTTTTNPSNKSVPSKISLNPSNKSVPSKISLNPSNKSVPSITSTNPSNKLIPSITSTNPSVGISSSARGLIIPDCPKHDKMKEKSKRSSIDLNDKVPTDVLAKKKVKRKPDTGSVGRQIRLEKEKPISSSGDEKSKSHNKQVVGPPSKPSPPINLNNPADMR